MRLWDRNVIEIELPEQDVGVRAEATLLLVGVEVVAAARIRVILVTIVVTAPLGRAMLGQLRNRVVIEQLFT